MTWKDTWSDIQNGGSKRWKVDDLNAKKIALGHILQHSSSKVEQSPLHILCPLAVSSFLDLIVCMVYITIFYIFEMRGCTHDTI